MAFIKSKKGFLALSAVVAAFALFAGVAFVQSQDVKPAVVKEVKVDASQCPLAGTPMCPKGEKASQQASAMPSSCSELHKQALAAGEMSKVEFATAETQFTDAKNGCASLRPEQCRQMMATHGLKCDETDMKACVEKIKAAGICKEMDPAKCAEMAKTCCASGGGMTTAKATSTTDAAVVSAVATERTGATGKQCDWTKGSCGTTQTASSDGK